MKNLVSADPPFDVTAPIDCLLGADKTSRVLLGGVVSLGEGYPLAMNTSFGYVLRGSSLSLSSDVSAPENYHVSLAIENDQSLFNSLHKF